MDIVNHPLCTTSIGAPSDMQDDCSALPVAYRTDAHGTWAMSFWKPNDAELAQLGYGGFITLHVRAAGRQHPVVAMGTYPASTPATLKEIAASDNDPDMGRGVSLLAEIEWCLNHGTCDARVEALLERCQSELPLLLAAPPDLGPMIYPPTMTPELEHVLGLMNFRTGPIAHVFQKAGFAIPTKCEAEQAFVLDRLIRAVLTHGEGWSDAFNADVRAQFEIIEGKKPPSTSEDPKP